MKKGLLVLGFAVVAGAANAVMVIGGSLIGSENFDGLPGTTQTAYFSTTVGVQTILSGTTFEGTKLGGTGTTGMNLVADDGTNNSGAVHSLANTGTAERAAGMLASGTNIPGVGVEIRNGSGLAWTTVTVTFVQEDWRSSTSVQNVMAASWGRTGGGMSATDYISSAAMAAVTSLDLVGPAAVATNGALNGNDPLNQHIRNFTFVLNTPLAAGDSLFIRWQDVNDAGNDADLAIDNFEVRATAVPEPATIAVLGLGAAALLRRRRK